MGGGRRTAPDDDQLTGTSSRGVVEGSLLSYSDASTTWLYEGGDPTVTSHESSPSRSYGDSTEEEEQKEGAKYRRRWNRTYDGLMRSYQACSDRSDSIEALRHLILNYRPGVWIEEVGGTTIRDYEVPKTTTLLLIGPSGSGKSALVNSISRFFEEDDYLPDRAQVTHNFESDGSCFLQEYMIPRNSKSFCLYDTRSLSEIPADNYELLSRWMTSGVGHGDMVIRNSDTEITRKNIKAMARQGCSYLYRRKVNFVILVIDAVSVLDAMDKKNARYNNMLVELFGYPFLTFKDSKPAVVVTHVDELSLSKRARVRTYLGELLGIPPSKQIFDISDIRDCLSEFAMLDMLRYCLEHADRNLPLKRFSYRVLRLPPWLVAEADKVQIILEVIVIVLLLALLFFFQL